MAGSSVSVPVPRCSARSVPPCTDVAQNQKKTLPSLGRFLNGRALGVWTRSVSRFSPSTEIAVDGGPRLSLACPALDLVARGQAMQIPTIGEFLDSMHLRYLKNILIKNRVMSVGVLADLQPSDIKRLACYMIGGVRCFTNANKTVIVLTCTHTTPLRCSSLTWRALLMGTRCG